MKRIVVLLILLLMLLIPAGTALAAPGYDQIIEEGEEYNGDISLIDNKLIVKQGGIVDGNINIFDGQAMLEGRIDGDVALFGGEATLSGTVDGNFVAFGGNLTVLETAHIDGDCIVFGGNVEDDSSSTACTSFASEFELPFETLFGTMDIEPPVPPAPPELPDAPVIIEPPRSSFGRSVGRFFGTVGEIVGRSLLMGLFALIAAAVLPSQLRQVSGVVQQKPAASGAVGLLTAVAAPSLITLLALVSAVLILACGIGLLGFPILLALALGLAAAMILGWIAVGQLFGNALSDRLNLKNRNLMTTTVLGTVVLTLLVGLLGAITSFGEGFVSIILGCVGLGATALTKFGTRPYPPASNPPPNDDKINIILDTTADDAE